jgi:glycine betaine/proline transport system ATP-binding protein
MIDRPRGRLVMSKGLKIDVRDLVKIFGPAEKAALRYLQSGASRTEIQQKAAGVVGVAGVSFCVEEGEIFVVMGLSGSGKSTLIRCINRLIAPTSGHVFLDGEDILSADEERIRELRRTKIAMVFQQFALFPHKTVAANVEYGLKVRGLARRERRERALIVLDLVGLRKWADFYPTALSGGMQQRVGLARALAVDPEILLMDEPFGALDPPMRREMQRELLELQRLFRKTIVFITHDLHEALSLGDRIAIMKDGQFVQVAVPIEIVTNPADGYVESFTQDVDRGRLFTASSVMQRRGSSVLREQASLDDAVRLTESAEGRSVFVTDQDGKPVGLILGLGLRHRATGAEATVHSIMRRDFPVCAESAPLNDIYHLCTAGLPIAVVDSSGRFVGTISPLDVFAKLGSGRVAILNSSENDRDHPKSSELERAEQTPKSGLG